MGAASGKRSRHEVAARSSPTAEQRSNVEVLVGYGMPETEICQLGLYIPVYHARTHARARGNPANPPFPTTTLAGAAVPNRQNRPKRESPRWMIGRGFC